MASFLGVQLDGGPDRTGSVVGGRYRVAAFIANGGMGTVYRAEDTRDGGMVALKVLRAHLGQSEEAIARFEREAMVGGRMDHPNCVGVTDIGRCDDGAIFLVMELLDGEGLLEMLGREGRIPWRRALHLVRHVLRGLAHAHAAGVVHRDIKPENIVVCRRDGDPDFARVLDFGIAKMIGGAPGVAITQAGMTIGTPAYLSPEQATGGELEGTSDLYSLTVVLFEMLTGRPPFVDPDLVKVLTAHASAPVPAIADVVPGLEVPRELEALIGDGLAKRPAERIPSAAAYIARIDGLLGPADAADTALDGIAASLDGRYRVLRLIGCGAVARVFLARHVGLDRPVAIKVLEPHLVADDEARRRFDREAQATARLRHPNCVAVTDSGTTPDGRRFLVMDLIEGRALDDVLAEQPRLPLPRALHVMRHLLRGLAHAHGLGLVHRDLKPGNIMLVDEGGDRDFVKILDFGLARMIDGDGDRVTRAGMVCGTPHYMSPEQIQDRGFDARTDLYAAAAILFEMLAGRPPFDADESVQILKLHLTAPPPRIEDAAPGVIVPPALEALLQRALAKRAEDRPATAEQFLDELDRAAASADTVVALAPRGETIVLTSLDSMIVPALPPPPPAPARRFRATRRQLAVAGAVAGILVVGIIAAVAGGSSPAPARPSAAFAPVEADVEVAPEPAPVDPEVAEALRLAAGGRNQEAATRLRALRKQRPDDPHVPYALGRVYHRLGWPKQTIAAYRDAITLEPALREDPELIADVVALLGSKSAWKSAAAMLEHDIGTAALPALTETAQHHRSATVRDRAERLRSRL
jgi:serine/threonine protein kinase